jgi:hypothetical protein
VSWLKVEYRIGYVTPPPPQKKKKTSVFLFVVKLSLDIIIIT